MCSVAVTEIVFIIAQGYKVFCVQMCGSVGNINATGQGKVIDMCTDIIGAIIIFVCISHLHHSRFLL